MAVVAKFVDKIDSGADRLDLNTSPWTLHKDSRFDAPGLRRSVAESMLRDGADIPASAYDNRVLQLRLVLQTTSADTLSSELQKLARELDRPNNILKLQWNGATNPVYFRTFRSPGFTLEGTAEHLGNNDVFVHADVLAEPFAYGEREQALSAVTITNDPAAGSNGMFVDITGVLGDVETPAFFSIPANSSRLWYALGMRRHGAPANGPFFLQAESMVARTDTSLQANSASMSGAGQNYMRTTFATNAALVTRLDYDIPGTISNGIDLRGTYRVLAIVATNSSTTVSLRVGYGDTSGNTVFNETVTGVDTSGVRKIIDLGLVELPGAFDVRYPGLAGAEIAADPGQLYFQAQRTGGAGTLDIDLLILVPADEELMFLTFEQGPSGGAIALDAANEAIFLYSGTAFDAASWVLEHPGLEQPEHIGAIPYLTPNQTNRLIFIVANTQAGSNPSVAYTTALSCWYWPRFLYAQPA